MALFLWHYNKASDNAIVSWGRHTTRHSAPLIAFQLLRFCTAAVVIKKKIKFLFFSPQFFYHHERHPVLNCCVSVLYASDFTTEYAFHSRANRTVYTEVHLGEAFQQRLEPHGAFSQFNFINSEGLYQPQPQQVLKCCCGESSKHYR